MGNGKRKREETSSVNSFTSSVDSFTSSVDSSTYPISLIKMKDRHKAILSDLIGDVVSVPVEINGRLSGRAFWENLTKSFNTRIQNRCRRCKPFHGYAALEVICSARELKAYYNRHKNDANPPENIEQFERAFGGGKLLSIPTANAMLGSLLVSSRRSHDRSCDRRSCCTSGGQTSRQNMNSITDTKMAIVECITAFRADKCISFDEAMYVVTLLNSAGEEITRALFMRLCLEDQIAYIKKILNERED